MKVLIIPEDQSVDPAILTPVVERLFENLGRPADVRVLPEPRMRGATDALSQEIIRDLVETRRTVDLFLLIVDRDCNRKNHEEKAAAREAEHPGRLIACLAVQEIEVWLLALHRAQLDAAWPVVRAECDPKEKYAWPLLERMGWSKLPQRGHSRAMRELPGQWKSLLSLCPEIGDLKQRIAEHLAVG